MPTLGTTSTETDPFYLYIPTRRYILMSFFTVGLYQTYWIFKNRQYVKNRDNLKIHPFWRAIFGIFFCNSLFKQIHDDPVLQHYKPAAFNPTNLAAGWIIFLIGGNLFSRIGDEIFPGYPEIAFLIILLLLGSRPGFSYLSSNISTTQMNRSDRRPLIIPGQRDTISCSGSSSRLLSSPLRQLHEAGRRVNLSGNISHPAYERGCPEPYFRYFFTRSRI
jgi:hypothetical protein